MTAPVAPHSDRQRTVPCIAAHHTVSIPAITEALSVLAMTAYALHGGNLNLTAIRLWNWIVEIQARSMKLSTSFYLLEYSV